MAEAPEQPEAHKNPGESVPPTPPADTVTIPKSEHVDLTHRAEVSSQNFERAKKAEAEVEALTAENQLLREKPEVPSSPADTNAEVKNLQSQLHEVQTTLTKKEVIEQYPVLKDLWGELETFRAHEDNKGMNLRTAAKAFLVEKGLLEPQRKGLEKPTGGPRAPVAAGMTADDVKRLRETDYRKYMQMVKNGQIKIS